MEYYSGQITKLIDELSRLPGIGAKSAQRLAFHIINMPEEQVDRLASSMTEARRNIRYCKECCTLTDQELCPVCRSAGRDHKTIMVVETPRDMWLMRRPEDTTGSIMYSTAPYPRCWGSVPGI